MAYTTERKLFMGQHEDKIAIVEKYKDKVQRDIYPLHIKGHIPSKKITNAINSYANGVDRNTVIALCDTTVLNSGKRGYLLTDTRGYFRGLMESVSVVSYNDVVDVVDNVISVDFILYDGSKVEWKDISSYVEFRRDFVNMMKEIIECHKKWMKENGY